MKTIDLARKTAIVTGAGQGLGQATATALHRAGANVVINYVDDDDGRNMRQAHDVAESLGDRAMPVKADVRDPSDVHELYSQTIKHFGAVDIVVNNAGIIRDRTVAKMTTDEWNQVIDTNLSGVFHVSKEAALRLSDGGRIVNMSSISGVVGSFGQANYASAKAGVIALTKVLSRELAKRGITVNAVAPGVVLTEMGRSIPQQVLDQMLTHVPLKRFGEPEDIANAVLFLCSDLASYITGQTIHVNGGWWG